MIEGSVRIPLRNRAGEVRAYALVDVADLDAVRAYRWSLDNHGYACRTAHWRDSGGKRHGERIAMHRAIMGLVKGDGLTVDHINHDTLDNRRANLRVLSHLENNHNRKGGRGRSRFRGVAFDRSHDRWRAQAVVAGRCHYLGLFDDEIEAAKAAESFRRDHMPAALPDRALREVLN